MESQNNEHLPWELSSQLVSIMTTEHYNLQTGYAISTSEVNGRSSLFVGAVSSALIALAFVGQLSHLGTAFYVFSLVVLPTLFFMGLITFERMLQANNATLKYASGINRIRHLYLEYAPQMQPYFILSSHDDLEVTLSDMGMKNSSRWQVFFSMEEDHVVGPSLSPSSSSSRAMMTDGSSRRVKSGSTKARRTVPDWSIRKVPATGRSHESLPLNAGRSAPTCR